MRIAVCPTNSILWWVQNKLWNSGLSSVSCYKDGSNGFQALYKLELKLEFLGVIWAYWFWGVCWILATPGVVRHLQHCHYQRASAEMQTLRPHPELQNQNLHFKRSRDLSGDSSAHRCLRNTILNNEVKMWKRQPYALESRVKQRGPGWRHKFMNFCHVVSILSHEIGFFI